MKNNIIKKLAAVLVTTAMIGTGFSLVSAADVSDIEVQAEEAEQISEEPVTENTEEAPEEAAVTETEPTQDEETETQPEESQEIQVEPEETAEENGETSDEDITVGEEAEAFAGQEEAAETEESVIKTDFLYENEEVVITAKVSEEAALPENAEIKAEKLMPGDPRYEEAKKASIDSLGTAEDAEYTFYDVTFTVDGNEVELPKGAAVIQMEFKNAVPLEETDKQSALHISKTDEGTVAEDVTAQSDSEAVSSADFSF